MQHLSRLPAKWLSSMPKWLKRVILVVAALLLLASMALRLFLDAGAYRAGLEAAAGEALGMEVAIEGRLEISLFPGLHVTLGDVHVRRGGTDLASVGEVGLGVPLLSLLQRELRIETIGLKRTGIFIERGRDGRFNFENTEAAKGGLPALQLARLKLSDGTVSYRDRQSGEEMEAAACRLDVARLQLLAGSGSDFMKNLSLAAEIACAEVRIGRVAASDLKASLAGGEGVFELSPVTMRLFGASGSASAQADFSGDLPLYHIRYTLPRFRIEDLFRTLSPQKVAGGTMDFSADLSLQGKDVQGMKRKMEGRVVLAGENLTFHGGDLDQMLSRIESSRNFGLVDAGAFFLAGPFGLMVSKGYDFASIFHGAEGSSRIDRLVSDWKVRRGVAQAQDVAMATSRNRLALRGHLDFVRERFEGITVAQVDSRGCVMVQQKIDGAFGNPEVEKPNVLESLASPAIQLLKKGMDLLSAGECEVFYAGSVAPPT